MMMIDLFEELGARRAEIQAITVAQVFALAKVAKPLLDVTTLKRGEIGLTRSLELSSDMLRKLLKYIRSDRWKVMKRFKSVPDHGYLFITERGGRPLGIDTFTTEFSLIRRAAGIEEQACAHLFRHSYCTNVVADLIAGIQAISPDSFRQTLMTNKMIAEHAMAKTGHSTLESLLGYVDSAFKIKSKYDQILKHVEYARTFESYEKRRKRLLDDFEKDKMTKAEFIERSTSLTESMHRDMEVA